MNILFTSEMLSFFFKLYKKKTKEYLKYILIIY